MDQSTNEPRHPPGSDGSCHSDQHSPKAPLPFVEKEHMFDKVVTPSDVGKLNRLVIPKQHAEKYFPMDASSSDKGLLLSFEDRTGKSWRFRYSYWNSSQSYVMTKGWSRFVKEKHLDAGDSVSFGRGVGETGGGRLFIDWKRRQDALGLSHLPRLTLPSNSYHHQHYGLARSGVPWGRLVWQPSPSIAMTTFDHQSQLGYNGYTAGAGSNPYLYLTSAGSPLQVAVQLAVGRGGGGDRSGELDMPVVLDSVPVVQGSAVAKKVRLFGVNLDCPATEANSEGDSARQPPLQLSTGASEMVESPRKDKEKLPMLLDLM